MSICWFKTHRRPLSQLWLLILRNLMGQTGIRPVWSLLLFLTLSVVTLFLHPPPDYFKCCCLPSLQITSSSLFSTEKVSLYYALKLLLELTVCFLIWNDLVHLIFSPQIHTSFSTPCSTPLVYFLFVSPLFYILFLTVPGDDKGSCFSFLRFIDVSPAEMSNLMLQGTLVRWASSFHL